MMELEALQEVDFEVRALGARIVALTPELERYTRRVHKKLNLTFDILTDLHLNTAEEVRLVFVLPDRLRDLYKSFGIILDRFHDESEYRLPMPARYVIDPKGIIRAADVNADYTIRSEPSETVTVLRTLTVRGAAGRATRRFQSHAALWESSPPGQYIEGEIRYALDLLTRPNQSDRTRHRCNRTISVIISLGGRLSNR